MCGKYVQENEKIASAIITSMKRRTVVHAWVEDSMDGFFKKERRIDSMRWDGYYVHIEFELNGSRPTSQRLVSEGWKARWVGDFVLNGGVGVGGFVLNGRAGVGSFALNDRVVGDWREVLRVRVRRDTVMAIG